MVAETMAIPIKDVIPFIIFLIVGGLAITGLSIIVYYLCTMHAQRRKASIALIKDWVKGDKLVVNFDTLTIEGEYHGYEDDGEYVFVVLNETYSDKTYTRRIIVDPINIHRFINLSQRNGI